MFGVWVGAVEPLSLDALALGESVRSFITDPLPPAAPAAGAPAAGAEHLR